MENPTWYVLGAGSIGSLWAASLCARGLEVALIRKSGHSQQRLAERSTVTLSTDAGSHSFPVKITTAAELSAPITKLLVCTKAQDARQAVESIRQHLAENGQILLLQNGMGSQNAIAQAFPDYSVWAGSTTDGAWLKGDLDVCHAGKGSTWIGPLTNNPGDGCFRKLTEQFSLKIQVTDHIETRLWEKLAINSCINGLTALYNCRNGELMDNTDYLAHMNQLAHETEQVLRALGISLEEPLTSTIHRVCELTQSNISSTCQDARMHRLTELAFINGFLIQSADTQNIGVATHRRLMHQLEEKGIRI